MKKAKLDKFVSTHNPVAVAEEWLECFSRGTQKHSVTVNCPSLLDVKASNAHKPICLYFSEIASALIIESNVGEIIRHVTDLDRLQKYLLLPIEMFICHGESGLEDVLKEYSKPNKYCGNVFDSGDPTYCCKECSNDPTCVFCHQCFFNSKHKNHKYKMHTSNGKGGYCDCGDEEAWSSDPSCDLHKDGFFVDQSNPLDRIPNDLRSRLSYMISFLLQYCVDVMLCFTDERKYLPDGFTQKPENDDTYIVMLYNDETHTFDEVSYTLLRAVKCNERQAMHYVNTVDKKGRSAVYTGKQEKCKEIAAECEHLTSLNTKPPLKCCSIPYDIVAHQLVALSIMKWLSGIAKESDVIRRLISILVTKELPGRKKALVNTIICVDSKMWKDASSQLHDLFINRILLDQYGRVEFAKIYAETYGVMARNFVASDNLYSVSVASLSVQIFTVPTIAQMLMLDHEILSKCFLAYWNEIKPFVAKGTLNLSKKPNKIEKAAFIFNDTKNLLHQNPFWYPKMLHEFYKTFDIILKIMSAMQGMDPCVRKVKKHVTYDPNWQVAFHLSFSFVPVVNVILNWCVSDVQVFKTVFRRCIRELLLLYQNTYENVLDGNYEVIQYNVSKKSVSIHATLSRFIAALVPSALKLSLDLKELIYTDEEDESSTETDKSRRLLTLLEPALRSLVFFAQVKVKKWVRNGDAVMNQIYHYQNSRYNIHMFDKDLLLLQTIATLMDPDQFLVAMLNKYDLDGWFSKQLKKRPRRTQDSDDDTVDDTVEIFADSDEERELEEELEELSEYKSIVQIFFHTLYFIFSERYVVNISEVTSEDILKRHVIHQLAVGGLSRSVLIKKLPYKNAENNEICSFEKLLDEVLKDVADHKKPKMTGKALFTHEKLGKALFTLKKEYWPLCNRYYYHYSDRDRERMSEKIKKQKMDEERQNDSQDNIISEFIFPEPPKFVPHFSKLLGVLQCDRMGELLGIVLSGDGEQISGETVELVILMIGIGLIEQKRKNENVPNFIDLIHRKLVSGKSVRELLEEKSKKQVTSQQTAMLKWLLQLVQSALPSAAEEMVIDGVDFEMEREREKKRRKEMVQKYREEMMQKMANMQKAFITSNQQFYDSEDINKSPDISMEVKSVEYVGPVAIGVNCSPAKTTNTVKECILCRKEGNIDNDKSVFVVMCFQQRSCILQNKSKGAKRCIILPEFNDRTEININSCGHVMHWTCWKKYWQIHNHRQRSADNSRLDVKQYEYLCPLCNGFCNSVIPLLPRSVEERRVDIQEMKLNEFMPYLQRFRAELEKCPKKERERITVNMQGPDQENQHSITATQYGASYTRQIFRNIFIRVMPFISSEEEIPTINENFMEMFAKTLLQFTNEDANSPTAHAICLSWISFSFSMQALECSYRNNGTSILEDLPERYYSFLNAYVQYLNSSCHIGVYEPIAEFGLKVLDLFCNDNGQCILEVDVFGVLVSLRFLVTAVMSVLQDQEIPHCLLNDVVFRLTFVMKLVKILITTPALLKEEMTDTPNTEWDSLVDGWNRLQMYTCRHSHQKNLINGFRLKEHVMTSLLPFLKISALFFHMLTGVSLPKFNSEDVNGDKHALESLLTYLNLPTDLPTALSLSYWENYDPNISKLIKSWCSNEDLETVDTEIPCHFVERSLIELPVDYSVLLQKAAGFKCPTIGDTSLFPALCLVCGVTICNQCCYCIPEKDDRYGACALHTLDCGKGVGMFLQIRSCNVLVMCNYRFFLMASPYLDEYGECDQEFLIGNPLSLDKERYDHLKKLWITQKIPEMVAQSNQR